MLKKAKVAFLLVIALVFAVQGIGMETALAAVERKVWTADEVIYANLLEGLGEAAATGLVAETYNQSSHSEANVIADKVIRRSDEPFLISGRANASMPFNLVVSVELPIFHLADTMTFGLYTKNGDDYTYTGISKTVNVEGKEEVELDFGRITDDDLRFHELYVFQIENNDIVEEGTQNSDDMNVEYGPPATTGVDGVIYIGSMEYALQQGGTPNKECKIFQDPDAQFSTDTFEGTISKVEFGPSIRLYKKTADGYEQLPDSNGKIYEETESGYGSLIDSNSTISALDKVYIRDDSWPSTWDNEGYFELVHVSHNGSSYVLYGEHEITVSYKAAGKAEALLDDLADLSYNLANSELGIGGTSIQGPGGTPLATGGSTVTGTVTDGKVVSLYTVPVERNVVQARKYLDAMSRWDQNRQTGWTNQGLPIAENEYIVINVVVPAGTEYIDFTTDASNVSLYNGNGDTDKHGDWGNGQPLSFGRLIWNPVTWNGSAYVPYEGRVYVGAGGAGIYLAPNSVYMSNSNPAGNSGTTANACTLIAREVYQGGQEIHQTSFDSSSTYVRMTNNPAVDVFGTKAWVGCTRTCNHTNVTVILNAQLYEGAEVTPIDIGTFYPHNGQWNWSFEGLPKYYYDENGTQHEIQYTVTEVGVYQHNVSKSGNMNDGFTITNTYTENQTTVNGTKIWDDDDDRDQVRPDSVVVTLQRRTVYYDQFGWKQESEGWADYNNKKKTVTAAVDWTFSFGDLPLSTVQNYRTYYYEYRVVEYIADNSSIIPDVYVPRGEEIKVNNQVVGYAFTQGNGGTYSVTNKHNIETVDISGTKTWNDKNNPNRPTAITIRLFADGVDTGKSVTVRRGPGGNWPEWHFNNVPKYEEGEEIVYTVVEDPVSYRDNNYNANIGYSPEYDYSTDSDGNVAVNITNTIKTVFINGVKVWTDYNRNEFRPETLDFQIYRVVLGENESAEQNDTANDVLVQTVTGKKDSSYSWAVELPTYDSEGNEVQYYVVEPEIPNYTSSSTSEKQNLWGKPTDVYTFTNTLALETEVELSATKKLNGENYTGEDFTFKLQQVNDQGQPVQGVEAVTVNVAEDGKVTFPAIKFDLNSLWNPGGYLDSPKTFYYAISEENGGVSNVEYDTTVFTAEVKLEIANKQLSGTVKYKKGYEDVDGAVFENTTTISASGSLALKKTDADTGAPISGVVFTVYSDEACNTSVGTMTEKDVTNNPGVYTLENLAAGTYYVKETVPEGYRELAADHKYTVTVVAGKVINVVDGTEFDAANATLALVTNKAITSVSVEKVWNDNNNAANKRPASIQVQLKKNGTEPVGDTVMLPITLENNTQSWSYTWNDLDKYVEGTNTEIVYTVDEVEVPENYIKTVATNDNAVTITNTYVESINVHFSAKKTLDGVDCAEGKFAFNMEGEKINGVATVSNGANGVVTFPEINFNLADMEDKQNGGYLAERTITYHIYEAIPEEAKNNNNTLNGVVYDGRHFYADVKLTFTDNQLAYTVTYREGEAPINDVPVFANTTEKVSISVTKVWDDNDNKANKRPASIDVQLHKAGVAEGARVTLPTQNGWSYTWENLPKYGSDGQEINYTVVEITTDDKDEPLPWTTEYVPGTATGNMDAGFTITNTKVADGQTHFEVTKAFNGTLTAGQFSFALLNEDGTKPIVDKDGKAITVTNDADGVAKFPVLTFDTVGTYKYQIKEIAVADDNIVYDGKTVNVEVTVSQQAGQLVAAVKYDGNDTATFTNTTVDEISVTLGAKKTLNDAACSDGKFTFSLEDEEGNVETAKNIGENGAVTFDPITFTLADLKNADGTLKESVTFTYTISEIDENAAGVTYDDTVYTAVVTLTYNEQTGKLEHSVVYTKNAGAADEEVLAQNDVPVFANTTEKVSISVTKVWEDNNNASGTRPASIDVHLYANGAAVTDKKLTLNAENQWAGSFAELDKYGADGKEITYTVAEITTEVDGETPLSWVKYYRTGEAVETANGFTITNTAITSVSVTKVWDDDNNASGTRPASIDVQLKKNGAAEGGLVTLSAETDWGYTWNNLPKYGSNGEKITYTVEEGAVEGYTKDIACDSTNGNFKFTITNTYSQQFSVSVPVKKTVTGTESVQSGFEFELMPVESNSPWTKDLDWWNGNPTVTVAPDALNAQDEDPLVATTNFGPFTYTDDYVTNWSNRFIYLVKEKSTTTDKNWKYDDRYYWLDYRVNENSEFSLYRVYSTTAEAFEKASEEWAAQWDESEPGEYDNLVKLWRIFCLLESDGLSLCEGAQAAEFVNTYEEEKTSISIDKQWTNEPKDFTGRPTELALTLYSYTTDPANAQEVTGFTPVVTGKDTATWTYTWSELPAEDEDGNALTYIVKEETELDGYVAIYPAGLNYVPANGKLVNKYVYEEYTFGFMKYLDGQPSAKEFEFTLTIDSKDTDNAAMGGTIKNDPTGCITVGPLTYGKNDLGKTYVYEIVETPKTGYYCDSTVYTVTVAVGADLDADGTLPLTVTYKKGDKEIAEADLVFENASAIEADLTVEKTLITNNVDDVAKSYSFTLTPDGATKPEQTISVSVGESQDGNDLVGGNTFRLSFAAPGTYTYTVKEVTDNKPGYKYDTKEYEVTYKVEFVNGKLQMAEGYPQFTPNATNGLLTFTNEYKQEAGSTTLHANKVFTDGDLTTTQFTFELLDEEGKAVLDKNGNAITATSNAKGEVTFPDLHYDVVGTYKYVIKEQIPEDQGGIVYDEKSVNVTVQVEKVGNELKPTVTYEGDEAEFTNTQLSTTGKVYVKKKFADNKTASGDYTFTMTPVDNAPVLNNNTLTLTFGETTTEASGEFQLPTYTAPGTYQYTVQESNTSKDANIEYDSTVYTVVVTVARVNDKLVATVASDDVEITATAPIVFTNKVLTTSLSGTKVWANDKETDRPEKIIIRLLADGVATGDIRELAPTETEWSFTDLPVNDANGDAITYTVSEDAVPGYVTNISGTTITNTKIGNGQATIEAQKVLNGATLTEGQFTFQLKDENGKKYTATNKADGTVTFPVLTYDMDDMKDADGKAVAKKTFAYTIKEVIPTTKVEGYTYDETAHSVNVEVEQDGSALVATVTYDGTSTEAPVFTNTYSETEATLSVTKKLVHSSDLPQAATFTFMLKDSEGNELDSRTLTFDAQSEDEQTVAFDKITYKTAGTYTYTIVEVMPEDATAENNYTVNGMAYDHVEHTAKVEVVQDEVSKQLAATVTYDGTSTEAPVFTNTKIADGEAVIQAKKTLNGAAPAEGQFTFRLMDAKGDVVEEKTNDAAGNVIFDAIQYSDETEETYTIVEVMPKGATAENKYTVNGMTYDPAKHTVQVKVVQDDASKQLVATVTYDGTSTEAPVFANTYRATGTTLDLSLSKKLENSAKLPENRTETFTFVLADATTNATKGEATVSFTKTSEETQTAAFGTLTFDAKGTYNYIITETASTKDDIITDTTKYYLEVKVEDVNGQLVATKTLTKQKGAEAITSAEAIEFVNTYDFDKVGELTLTATKAMSGRPFQSGDSFTFTVTGSVGAPVSANATVTIKPTSGNEATVDFGKISFTEVDVGKEYTYTIQETEPADEQKLPGVTYDTTEYTVTVAITKNADALVVTPTYANGEGVTITNTYANEFIEIKVTKAWVETDPEQQAQRPASVDVRLYVDDEPTDKVLTLNAGNLWTAKFTELPKYVTGTATPIEYTVKEITEGATWTANYTTGEAEGSMANGFTITNTNKHVATTEVAVTKVWVEANAEQQAQRPASVDVQLYADGVAVTGKVLTLTADDSWTGSFANLQKYVTDTATPIVYTVKEVTDADWLTNYTPGEPVKTATGYTITNTSKHVAKTEIDVTKVWVEVNDEQKAQRPESIQVQLYKGTEPVEGKVLTLNEGNQWTGSFTDLVKYQSDNVTPIAYTVKEITGDWAGNYTTSDPAGDMATGYTITNTSEYVAKTQIAVTKAWVETNAAQQALRPASVDVQLYADGEAVDGKVLTLTATDGWTGKFTDLVKYQSDNTTLIAYTVKEVTEGANWLAYYTPGAPVGDMANGFTITNTNTYSANGELLLTGTKTVTGDSTVAEHTFTFGVFDANGNEVATGTNDENGNITFGKIAYTLDQVGNHEYTVKETTTAVAAEVSDKYIVDLDETEYTILVTVANNTTTGNLDVTWSIKEPAATKLAFTNDFQLRVGNIGVVKVDSKDTKKGLSGAEFTVYTDEACTTILMLDGEKAIITTGETGAGVLDGLPIGTYWVKETKAPQHYLLDDETVYEVTVVEGDRAMVNEVNGAHVTNKKMAKLALEKSDRLNPSKKLPDAEYTLFTDEACEEEDILVLPDGTKAIITTGEDGVGELEGVPVGTYWVKETKAPTGYEVDPEPYQVIVPEEDDPEDPVFVAVSDFPLRGALSLSKTVVASSEVTDTFLFDIELTLATDDPIVGSYKATLNGAETDDVTFVATETGAKATVELKDGETMSIIGLRSGVSYTVTEQPNSRYDVTVNGVEATSATGTISDTALSVVKYQNTLKETGFTVEKVWLGEDAGEIKLTLYANGVAMDPQPVVTREGNTYSYADLVMKDENGEEIVYTVKETAMAGYTTTYENAAPNADKTDAAYNGGKIINQAMTTFAVKKEWSGLAAGEKAPAIQLTLYCNGKVYTAATPTPDKDGWYTYADLPAYVDGKLAVYTVKEEPVTGFTTTYINKGENAAVTDCAYNGSTIVNSKIPQTGDNTPLTLWMLTTLLAACGLMGVMATLRKREN